jgi:hypothetical protein
VTVRSTKRYYCAGCGASVDGAGRHCGEACVARARAKAIAAAPCPTPPSRLRAPPYGFEPRPSTHASIVAGVARINAAIADPCNDAKFYAAIASTHASIVARINAAIADPCNDAKFYAAIAVASDRGLDLVAGISPDGAAHATRLDGEPDDLFRARANDARYRWSMSRFLA